jgi:hypothetical protein
VVVQILPPQRQTVHDALTQHVAHPMRDQQRIARVGNAARRRSRQPNLAVCRRQQHHPAITGHAATVKAALDPAPAQPPEVDHPHIQLTLSGTVWIRHCPLAHQDSTPR